MVNQSTDYIWSFLGKLSSFIGVFSINMIIARNLSVNDFAQFSLLMSIIPSSVILFTFGQDISSSKMLENSINWQTHVRNILNILLLNFILMLILFFIIGVFYKNQLTLLITLFLIIFLSSVMRVVADLYRANDNFSGFVLFNSIRSHGGILFWIFFLSNLFILYYNDYLILDNIFYAIALACSFVLITFFALQSNKEHFKENFYKIVKAKSKNFFSFYKTSFYLMLSSLLIMLRFDHDIWVVSYFAGKNDLALYASIIKIIALVMAPIAIFESLIPKKIAHLHLKNDLSALESYVRRISTFMFIAGLSSILLIYLFAEQIIGFTFGEFFTSAKGNLRLALLAFTGNILLGPCASILLIIKYEKVNVLINLFFLFISVFLGSYLTSVYGYRGMVINYVIVFNLVHVIFYLFVLKYIKINPLPYFNIIKAFKYDQ
tara:strand:+ start:2918 stop:4219 length:1302 start_codon:yes stop_codon:yes gene_type:complete